MAGVNTQFAVATHVLTYLAGAGGGRDVSSAELARSVNVNPVHIRRVLGPLREAGIVSSRPGAAGGWELVRDPAAIHLDEVWSLLSDDPVMASHGPNPDCPVGRRVAARLREIEGGIEDAVRGELHGRTVADFA